MEVSDDDVFYKVMDSYNFDAPLAVTITVSDSEEESNVCPEVSKGSNQKDAKIIKPMDLSSDTSLSSAKHEPIKSEDTNISSNKTELKVEKNKNTNTKNGGVSKKKYKTKTMTNLITLLGLSTDELIAFDLISKNILRIVQVSHQFHLRKNESSEIRTSYEYFKKSIFYFCYAYLIKYVLPRERSYVYIRELIYNALKIADFHKIKHLVSYDSLECQLWAMIQWAKHKQRQKLNV